MSQSNLHPFPSFSTGAPPLGGTFANYRNMMSNAGPGIRQGAKIVGSILGAGMLVAAQQIAYEEGRTAVSALRSTFTRRRARNEALTAFLARSTLPADQLEHVYRARDGYKAVLALVCSKDTSMEDRHTLGAALAHVRG